MMQSHFLAPAVLVVLIGGCTSVPPGGSARDAQGVIPPATAASAPIQLKTMSLDEFMPGRLSVSVSVPVVAPAAWELASLPKASAFSAYWMKPQDVEVANRTQDLPADNGYMYGNISDSVGYDRRRDVFIGADDPRTLAMLQTNLGVFSTVVMERFTHGHNRGGFRKAGLLHVHRCQHRHQCCDGGAAAAGQQPQDWRLHVGRTQKAAC